jgi:hypothetical protein
VSNTLLEKSEKKNLNLQTALSSQHSTSKMFLYALTFHKWESIRNAFPLYSNIRKTQVPTGALNNSMLKASVQQLGILHLHTLIFVRFCWMRVNLLLNILADLAKKITGGNNAIQFTLIRVYLRANLTAQWPIIMLARV